MRAWSETSRFNRTQVDTPVAGWDTTAVLTSKRQHNMEVCDEALLDGAANTNIRKYRRQATPLATFLRAHRNPRRASWQRWEHGHGPKSTYCNLIGSPLESGIVEYCETTTISRSSHPAQKNLLQNRRSTSRHESWSFRLYSRKLGRSPLGPVCRPALGFGYRSTKLSAWIASMSWSDYR